MAVGEVGRFVDDESSRSGTAPPSRRCDDSCLFVAPVCPFREPFAVDFCSS